jgi:hypothetical protein
LHPANAQKLTVDKIDVFKKGLKKRPFFVLRRLKKYKLFTAKTIIVSKIVLTFAASRPDNGCSTSAPGLLPFPSQLRALNEARGR